MAISIPGLDLKALGLERLVKRIEVKTAYGPDIVVDRPFEGPSTVGPWMAKLRPQVTIEVEGIGKWVSAPYGAPPPTKWPVLVSGAAAGGIVLGTLALLGLVAVARGR